MKRLLVVALAVIGMMFLCGTVYAVEEDIVVLTNASPNTTIITGSDIKVYGTAGANSITIESGAYVGLFNVPGNNIITIEADSSLFTVSRSGAYITFDGIDGTVLKMPATTTSQSIIFNDGSRSLIIDSNHVMLGDQEINLTPAAINTIYYPDLDGDGYGDPNISYESDHPLLGYVTDNTDCNDSDSSIHPGATEIDGDGVDQDCNGRDLDSDYVLILDYMEIKHNLEFLDFEEDQKAIDRELAAKGQYLSGVRVKRYIENAKNHINSFVNDSIEYVISVTMVGTINPTDISKLFDNHKSIDTSYFTNHTIGYTLNEIIPFIDDTYALAKLRLFLP